MSRRPADLEPDTQDDGPGAPSAASAHGAADARGRHPARPAGAVLTRAGASRARQWRPPGAAGTTAADRRAAPRRRELAVAALGALGGARAGRGRVPRQQPGQPQLVEGRAHLLTVREPGAGRQRQEHRVQQVDGHDQRRLRGSAQREGRVHELGSEGRPPAVDARHAAGGERRSRVRRLQQQHLGRHPHLRAAVPAADRRAGLDEPAQRRARWAR